MSHPAWGRCAVGQSAQCFGGPPHPVCYMDGLRSVGWLCRFHESWMSAWVAGRCRYCRANIIDRTPGAVRTVCDVCKDGDE